MLSRLPLLKLCQGWREEESDYDVAEGVDHDARVEVFASVTSKHSCMSITVYRMQSTLPVKDNVNIRKATR